MRRPPRASLAAAAIVVLAGVWAAGGGDKLKTLDLLDLPGPATSRGAHKLLLDVGAGGPGLVAVGEMGLMLASADQGRTWTQQPSPSSVMYTGVSFVDARTGWAVGHDGVIVATTDGGRSWKRQFDGRKANEAVLAAARAHLERLNAQAGNDEAGAKK
ncbi:MAG: glycosyl hydrolase, partial [Aquabacterium sp.]